MYVYVYIYIVDLMVKIMIHVTIHFWDIAYFQTNRHERKRPQILQKWIRLVGFLQSQLSGELLGFHSPENYGLSRPGFFQINVVEKLLII